jgi:hypothetical protein
MARASHASTASDWPQSSKPQAALEVLGRYGTFVRMTAQPNVRVPFRRAIERRALWLAEDAARELPNLPLEDALQLASLHRAGAHPRLNRRRGWLVRYDSEATPSLRDVAKVTASLAKQAPRSDSHLG